MRNLIRRLKCWYYRDGLMSLETLVIANVTTMDWQEWAEKRFYKVTDFVKTRYWLSQQGFIIRDLGRSHVTPKGVKWYESLTGKKMYKEN